MSFPKKNNDLTSDFQPDGAGVSSGVSIIIRTLNESSFLGLCLSKIKSQKANFPKEVILVDSGSTDNTVLIAESFGCKILHIPKAEFSYGKALNLGIEQAAYPTVVVISAHCIPIGKRWLEKLVCPVLSGTAEMVSGGQIAGRGSRTSEINYFQDKFRGASGFQVSPILNNSNSCFLRSLWAIRPFDALLPAQEDMDFAKWHMTNSRAMLYFCARAKVVHYHNDRNKTLFKRIYRERSVEFYLGQKKLTHLLIFLIKIPVYLVSDSITAYRKRVLRRAFKGIIAFRLMHSIAYIYAYLTYRKFIFRKL